MKFLCRFVLVYVVFLTRNIYCEVFTSIADMEQLVKTEQHLVLSLRNYIDLENQRLHRLKTFLSKVDKILQYVNDSDVTKYLGNPINTYLLLKRFHTDWLEVEDLLTTSDNEGI